MGGVASRHFWNSWTYSGGNSVGDDAMNCPSFTYVAPSSSHMRRRMTGGSGSVALVLRPLMVSVPTV